MFATLLGSLPRPPLAADASRRALVEAVVRAQQSAGIEPLTDGGLHPARRTPRGLGGDGEPDRAGGQAGASRAVQPGLVPGRRRGPALDGDARQRRCEQRHPQDTGRRRLPADRDPRALGDRDRRRCRRARAVPRGPPATPRRRRRDTSLARHHGRQRRRGRGRHDPRRLIREPRRRPHRWSRQLASRRGRTRRHRDRVRRIVHRRPTPTTAPRCSCGRRPTRPRLGLVAPTG